MGIKTFSQAIAIQTRRFNAGKKGVAKAVRRFMRKAWRGRGKDPELHPSRGYQNISYNDNPVSSYWSLPVNFEGCGRHDSSQLTKDPGRRYR